MSIGATMLGRRHVLPSVSSTLTEIMVEGTFPTGTYLVTVHHPISSDDGDLAKALYGSFLPIPDKEIFPLPQKEEYEPTKQPGAVVTVKGKIVLNEGRKRIKLKVISKGDRPIQVQSFSHIPKEALTLADWLSLPLHRDESPAGIRSYQGLWLPSGHCCWNFCSF
jgi:urease